MHSPLDIDVTWRHTTAVVALRGAVDLFSAPLLAEAVATAQARGATALEVELHDLRFIDSSGLGILLDAHRTFGGAITLQGASGLVLRVLEAAATAPALSAHDRRLAWAFAPTGTLSN